MVGFATLPLADVRRVQRLLGGTTNDVVLAAVAGALRTYFDRRGEELGSSLVALVPVSVRSEDERGALGNRVSAMLVSLATGVDDPVVRLREIRQSASLAKEQSRSIGGEVFAAWGEVITPAVAGRLSRLVSRVRLFDRAPPPCNVIVSNVPGPDFRLYFAGAPLEAMFPVGPIVEGIGLNVTVFSYLDTLHVGVEGCPTLVDDVAGIAASLRDSLAELVRAADRRDRPVPWWHAALPA